MRLFLALLIALAAVAGCSSSTSDPYGEQAAEAQAALLDEYSRYVAAIESDKAVLEKYLAKWNILIEQYNKGGSVDFSDLEASQRDYADQANLMKPKVASLKSFMDKNEAALKPAGIDVFAERQELDTLVASVDNNVRNMQAELEKLKS
ncbi:hypothetical protein HYY74_02680 [Candidatus Woesearchaeota archaeon]|nr:hypothetical protein [Candidatus Woesearchaeota archaeon]